MNTNKNWQLFGGYLILLLVALVFWRSSQEPTLLGADGETGDPITVTDTPLLVLTPTLSASGAVVSSFGSTDALPVLEDSSLAPKPNPLTYEAKRPSHTFQTYTVQQGDTPNTIADSQGISAETLLGGNPWLSQESNQLQAETELIILPEDGVLHVVKPGETLEEIAEFYDVSASAIVAYGDNNIEEPFYRLYPDSLLLIPGAQIGEFYWTAPKTVSSGGGGQTWAVVGTGFFAWPTSGGCFSQYYNYFHPGVDVAMPSGTAVVAADTGTVTYASWAAGSYYDYGNLIVINHGNGYETFYAHLSGINVYPGQTVTKGQYIGATGNSGRSSGPHIHFEIRLNDARLNPLGFLGANWSDCSGAS